MWLSLAGEVEARVRARGATRTSSRSCATADAVSQSAAGRDAQRRFRDDDGAAIYFDHAHLPPLRALARSTDARIAEIAAKAVKEVAYHAERSAGWVIRLRRRHRRIARADADGGSMRCGRTPAKCS
jgi:ring-1,2-phenylacetyl-CoA epoxidase subunit PaaC